MITKHLFKQRILMVIAALLLSGCQNDKAPRSEAADSAQPVNAQSISTQSVSNHTEKTQLAKHVTENQPAVKNVILMIGDGMGAPQVGLLADYARRAPNSIYNSSGHQSANKSGLTTLSEAGHVGLSLTSPLGHQGSLVVDSACSATQLATGVGAGSEMVGLDENGNVAVTILEKAKAQGKATGLVSDTRITHATPAAFASHQAHRSMENNIAAELISTGNVDVMLSGGVRHFVPKNIKANESAQRFMAALGAPKALYERSKRKDNRNILSEAKNQFGYALAFTPKQLAQADNNKVLGLFANSEMQDGIAYTACKKLSQCKQPSLREMTLAALTILSKNEKGFFLMVEGGQIDWAGHINDAGWMLHELLKFDEAVAAVYEWVKNRDDTLVVVTGDHETGGFGFSYSRHNLPKAQVLSGQGMAGHNYQPNFNFGKVSTLDRLYKQKGTFYDMMTHVSSDYDFNDSQASQWRDAVNTFSDFKISNQQALAVTKREANEFHVAHHKYLSAKVFPKINDFKAFYVYGDDLHGNLIARALSPEQNVVWATGTHTAAPVPVYAFGPESITRQFSTLQHHTDIAQKMMAALGL